MSFNRVILIIIGILAATMILVVVEASAQETQGFIYGRVHTSENAYQGVLRWGTEEIMWTDHFNATKSRSDYYQKIETEKKDNSEWLDLDWKLSSIWENKSIVFQFISQFGDLKELYINRDNNVMAAFKNGVELKLLGGSNDIGTAVRVYDEELGAIDVSWNRIKRVEFLPTPARISFNDTPLYGVVETSRKGFFKGKIVWDNDERLSSDKLNGESRDGRMNILFSDINSIEKKFDGSQVVLKSGREFFLNRSNDVNQGNRGVLVVLDEIGTVEVPWRAFEKLTLSKPQENFASYSSFSKPEMLSGKVFTFDKQEYSGKIVYDMDETWQFEMLEGYDDELKYYIPFRNIKSVKPKNFDYSLIGLRNGHTLLLGGVRDVSSDNDGILILRNEKDKPQYIRWRDVSEIIFK